MSSFHDLGALMKAGIKIGMKTFATQGSNHHPSGLELNHVHGGGLLWNPSKPDIIGLGTVSWIIRCY